MHKHLSLPFSYPPPLQTLEVILKVGFGEEMRFLDASGAGVDNPLYTSFMRLGRHVS